MGNELEVRGNYQVSTDVQELIESARGYAEESKASNTRRAYRGQWERFVSFCEEKGAQALPASPETVAVYAAFLADKGRKVATIEQSIAAIASAHEAAGQEAPTRSSAVKIVMKGIRRKLTVSPKRKQAITRDILGALLSPLGDTPRDLRDRALVLVGFAGAFRRSELVAVKVEDIQEHYRGILIRLPRSKTDQEGQGQLKALFYALEASLCPVRALRQWTKAAGISSGFIFQSITKGGKVTGRGLDPGDVARVIHRLQKKTGLENFDFSGHSLRAGFVTQANKDGKTDRSIARQTGHKSSKMLDVYNREEDIFKDNAGNGLL